MIRKLLFVILAFFIIHAISAQELQQSNPYYVGHSLVNFDMPWMVNELAKSGKKTSEYSQQIMNGASMHANYTNYSFAQGTPYTTALPTGKYDAFIITEAVPLENHTEWSDCYNTAGKFLAYARNYRPDIRYFIYETWHCINTGRTDTIIPEIDPRKCWYDNNDKLLWQPRLLDDFPRWAKIADTVKTMQNYENVFMVPAGQAFYKLSKSIDEGKVPGLKSYRQLFSDDIHLNVKGNYFVACVMYACIFRSSPEGLTNKIYNEWGQVLVDVPTEMAFQMQKAAWETVCENSYSGVGCTITGKNKAELQKIGITVFPVPVQNELNLQIPDGHTYTYTLTNLLGEELKSGQVTNTESVNISDISSGIYNLTLKHKDYIYSQKITVNK